MKLKIQILLKSNLTPLKQNKFLNEFRKYKDAELDVEFSSLGGNPDDFKEFLLKLKELKKENNLKLNLICKKEVASSGIYFLNNEYFDTIYAEKNCNFLIHFGYIYHTRNKGFVNIKNLNIENKELEKMCIDDLNYFGNIFIKKYKTYPKEAIKIIQEINKQYIPYYFDEINVYKNKLNPKDIETIFKNSLNIILHIVNDFIFNAELAVKIGFVNEIIE